MNWSALDQAGVLLQSGGGLPYCVRLTSAGGDPVVFVGMDLGHPRWVRSSWLVVSLVDHEGRLLAYYRRQQARDETARPEILAQALNWSYLHLRKVLGGDYQPVVLRDGRMLANESLQMYRPYWGDRFTLIEVIKHPVPLMIRGDACAPAGSLCVPDGSEYFFLVASRSRAREHVNLPLKVRVTHDGLALVWPR